MRYISERPNATYVWLAHIDQRRRDAEDAENPGIPMDTPASRRLAELAATLPIDDVPNELVQPASREEAAARYANARPFTRANTFTMVMDYRELAETFESYALEAERLGQIALAVARAAVAARWRLAVGEFAEAESAYRRAEALAVRVPSASNAGLQLIAYRYERCLALDISWEDLLPLAGVLLRQPSAERVWALAAVRAGAAVVYARVGQTDDSLAMLELLPPALIKAAAWSGNYPALACGGALALWWLDRTDHIEVIEQSLREKVIKPDFRYMMYDGRQALGQLSALQDRYDEASDWFAQARAVLDQQGARPLRAICDYDEALMFVRRRADGDRGRALPLLDAALAQFREIGMTGWVARAEELRTKLVDG